MRTQVDTTDKVLAQREVERTNVLHTFTACTPFSQSCSSPCMHVQVDATDKVLAQREVERTNVLHTFTACTPFSQSCSSPCMHVQVDATDKVLAQKEVERTNVALAAEKVRMQSLLQRQYQLIACLGKVSEVGCDAWAGAKDKEQLSEGLGALKHEPPASGGLRCSGVTLIKSI
jgi:hypothetical protein